MTDNDRPKFAQLMKVLGETYGNRPPTKERIEVYFRVLSEYGIDAIERAIIQLLKIRITTTTFPVPGEIVDAMGDMQSAAIVALDKAEKAAERYGAYAAVIFDDPIIHMVIASMGGWPKFCRPDAFGDNQAWHWKQKEFKSLYDVFIRSPRDCPKILIGMSDTTYEQGDETITVPPVIIGDEKKALEWTSNKEQRSVDLPRMKSIV